MTPITSKILLFIEQNGPSTVQAIVAGLPEHSATFTRRAIGRLQAQGKLLTVVSKGWGRCAVYDAVRPIVARVFEGTPIFTGRKTIRGWKESNHAQ